ncbi:MAG: SDR family oxidoreductase, partial [Lachnospiraceae bacterium]|nr:SDR family oxidoreductase [Lachnospiraceae bacterium]
MNHIFSLEGKTALVTGGATGLGLAMVQCITEAGGRVIVVSSSPYETYKDRIECLGEKVSYEQFDITMTEKTPAFMEGLIEKHGKIDILVNNAGIHCKKPIEDMSVEAYENVLRVHLVGAFAMTKAVVPYMRKNKKGNIIFIASMTSYIGQPYVMGYSTAKSGYLGMIHT